MDKNNLTYQTSGVNIKEADKFIKYISHIAKKTKQNKKSNNIGGFGSITKIPKNICVIDLSNDFRVNSLTGGKWTYRIADHLKDFIDYNVNDKFETKISNPGCYATSILSPLIPLINEKYIQVDDKNKSVKLIRIPKFAEVPYPVIMEPSIVIEYYSR